MLSKNFSFSQSNGKHIELKRNVLGISVCEYILTKWITFKYYIFNTAQQHFINSVENSDEIPHVIKKIHYNIFIMFEVSQHQTLGQTRWITFFLDRFDLSAKKYFYFLFLLAKDGDLECRLKSTWHPKNIYKRNC